MIRKKLHGSQRNGDTHSVNALIQAGAKLDLQNKDGNTALMQAVFNKDEKMVQYLLIQCGAKLGLHNDYWVNTPLTIAAKRGYNKIAFLIISAMSLEQITSALHYHPELKNLVNEFRKEENIDAIKSAALEANEYLVFPARMSLKWQAAKEVAKKYTHQDLMNQQDIPEDVINTVEASRKYLPL